MNIQTKDIRILQQFVNNADEFKKYILCQIWISQYFSNTLTEPLNIFKEVISNVSNANANISFRTYCECGLIIFNFCFYSLGVEEGGDFAPWQKMT